MNAWRLFTLEDKMEAAEEKAAQTDGDAAKRANMQQPAANLTHMNLCSHACAQVGTEAAAEQTRRKEKEKEQRSGGGMARRQRRGSPRPHTFQVSTWVKTLAQRSQEQSRNI